MEKNSTAKALTIIGIIEIIGGICLFFASLEESAEMGLIWLVAGIIFGIMFFGFSEIINLLQRSVDNQTEIIAKLDNRPAIAQEKTKTVLEDIESNLPVM